MDDLREEILRKTAKKRPVPRPKPKGRGALQKDGEVKRRCGSFTTEDLDLFPKEKSDSAMDLSDLGQAANRRKGSLNRQNSKSAEDIAAMFNKPKSADKPKVKGKPPPKPVKPAWKNICKGEATSTEGTNSDFSEDEKTKETKNNSETEENNKNTCVLEKDVKESDTSSPSDDMVKKASKDKMGNISSDGSVDSWKGDEDTGGSGKATTWVSNTMNEIAKRLEVEGINVKTPDGSPIGSPKHLRKPLIRPQGSPPALPKGSPPALPKGIPVIKGKNTPPPRPNQGPKWNNRRTGSQSPKQGRTNIPGNGTSPSQQQMDSSQSQSVKLSDNSPSPSPKRVRKKPSVPPPELPTRPKDANSKDINSEAKKKKVPTRP